MEARMAETVGATLAPQEEREASEPMGSLVVAVQGPTDAALAAAVPLADRLRTRYPQVEPVVLVASLRDGAPALVPVGPVGPATLPAPATGVVPSASQGAVPGLESPLGPLLVEGAGRSAAAVAIVAAERHDESIDWLDLLIGPVLGGRFDFVCPAYTRPRAEGAINSGIVAPLIRTLYGRALRQPLGTEAALSGALARRLSEDEDWRRRPREAGSDAWLLAKVLGTEARVAQSWLGAWPRPSRDPEELDVTLARALGLVFGEMERTAARWQRTGASQPVSTFGTGSFQSGVPPPDPVRLFGSFVRGLRDLLPVFGLVLPPATLLGLQQCAMKPFPQGIIPDELWARVVFDFSVAHLVRSVERGQLLRSLAPLYLGWLAGLAHAAGTLDDLTFEARVEAVGAAFEREKRYLVARWRWPDEFNP
jgi:hypothetical protein